MNFSNPSYDSIDEILHNNERQNLVDNSVIESLSGFEELRVSALTKAAKISPLVKEVTIGPNSPFKKELFPGDPFNGKPNLNVPEENLVEDKIRKELRHSLSIKDLETKIQHASVNIFEGLVEKMILMHAESMSKCFQKQQERCEAMKIKARKLQMLKILQTNDNARLLKEAMVNDDHSQQINKQTVDNLNRILDEQNKVTARFAAVTDSYTKICICCNEITNMLQNESDGSKLSKQYVPLINPVIVNITKIIDLCKSGNITDTEVKQAEILYLNIDNVKQKLINELDALKHQRFINQKAEELRKQEQEKKKLEEEEERRKAAELAQMQKVPVEQNKKCRPQFYSHDSYVYYEELKKYLEDYENNYKDLIADASFKKFRFDCQKAVNTPVNAISSVSGIHMRDKFDKLAKLLRGERVQVLDTFIMAAQHPQGLYYCTALLAKKIVRQGDLLVSSKPEAAFPLAAITVALWAQFPEFGKLLEAYFHRDCPYLVPMFLPQKKGQSDKEFYLSRGYTYNDNVVEKQDKFLKRMSGIFRLRCAIWISSTPRFVNAPNPHGINYGWQWLASFINLKPEPDICATLLFDFFTVCGSASLKQYGKQFIKIIKLISTDYLAILQNIDEGGPKSRLEVFLQNVLKTGHIALPNGLLQPNTW